MEQRAKLYEDAQKIYNEAIRASLPNTAVKTHLQDLRFGEGKIVLVAIGKAAWEMAHAAQEVLGDRIDSGVVVTKYQHSKGDLPRLQIVEAGHPVPDENSCRGAQAALDAVTGLTDQDTVLFLVSGGGSALFELTDIGLEQLQDLNRQLLACGADIREINTIRKRMSRVKGGRFAECCYPAKVEALVLSDVLGDPLDMIASGPACPDSTTCEQAVAIAEKYNLQLSREAWECLRRETPKSAPHVRHRLCGSVSQLCGAAEEQCRLLGYTPVLLTTDLCCTAREAGTFMGNIARSHVGSGKKLAFLAGGETVVQVRGDGLGGRNQELALSAAAQIAGISNAVVFSVGSDGTDGPTDAAGGYVDGQTCADLAAQGISIPQVLDRNDAYHALQACGGLIMTGPTGTNVNDLCVALIDG